MDRPSPGRLPAAPPAHRRQPIRRAWTTPSARWWRTRAARCSCWPGRARARPRRSWRRWSHRITERGIDPERVLVLTFSRKAAQELRERITTRLRRTTRQPLALTFHSYAYALVRREFVLAGDVPPTLLSGPEQLLEVRRMLRAEAAGESGRRASLAGAAAARPGHPRLRHGTARFPAPRRRARAGRAGAGPAGPARTAGTTGSPRAASWTATPPASTWRRSRPTTTPRSCGSPRAAGPCGDPGPGAQGLRRGAGGRVPGHRPCPGGAAARAGG